MLMTFFLNDILDFTIFYEIVNLSHFFQTCSFLFQQKLQYINYFFINRGCFTLEFYFNFIISHILIFKSMEDYTDYIFNYYTLTTLFNFKNFTDILSFDFFLKILEPFSNIYLVISDEEMIPLSDRLLTPPRSPGMPETDSSFFSSSININSEDISSESSEEEDDENSSPSSWFEIYIKNPIKRFLSKFGIINNPVVEESNLLSSTTETLNSSLFPNQNGDLTSNSVLSSENLASSSTETTERRTSWVEYLFLRPFEYVMGKLGFNVKNTTDFVKTDVVPTTNSSIPVDSLSETTAESSIIVSDNEEDSAAASEIGDYSSIPLSSWMTDSSDLDSWSVFTFNDDDSTTLINQIYEDIDVNPLSSDLIELNLDALDFSSQVRELSSLLDGVFNRTEIRRRGLNRLALFVESLDESSLDSDSSYIVPLTITRELNRLDDVCSDIIMIKGEINYLDPEDRSHMMRCKVAKINYHVTHMKNYDNIFPFKFQTLQKEIRQVYGFTS